MRILVVDDDPGLLRTLGIGLRAFGHEVLLAADGRTALQAAREDNPDLLVLDLGLPDVDGIEVLRRLRGWTSVLVIVLSARAGSNDKVESTRSWRRRLRHQALRHGRARRPDPRRRATRRCRPPRARRRYDLPDRPVGQG